MVLFGYRIPFITALGLTLACQAPAQADTQQLAYLKFTMAEYLIYTDQLQKLDATECGIAPVSPYSVSAAQNELLARIKPADQPEIRDFFASAQVAKLLDENSAGIQSLFGPQQITRGPAAMSEDKRSHCQELALAFQANLESTKSDLEQLFIEYRGE